MLFHSGNVNLGLLPLGLPPQWHLTTLVFASPCVSNVRPRAHFCVICRIFITFFVTFLCDLLCWQGRTAWEGSKCSRFWYLFPRLSAEYTSAFFSVGVGWFLVGSAMVLGPHFGPLGLFSSFRFLFGVRVVVLSLSGFPFSPLVFFSLSVRPNKTPVPSSKSVIHTIKLWRPARFGIKKFTFCT